MGQVHEFVAAPALGPLYRRALLRRGSSGTLPEHRLVLRDVRVDRSHLARYDRVCGFRLRDELPATYPHVLAFPLTMTLMTRDDFPFPLLGLVHVGNRIAQRRTLSSGEPLTLTAWAEDLRPHPRGSQLDVVVQATDASGTAAWEGRSTYLRRSRAKAPGTPATADPDADAAAARPSAVWRVERRVGADYAAASGDRNPIHTSRTLARLLGFPRTIAHGMWTKARCLAALEGRLPAAFEVEVAFKRPILLPATVAFTASRTDDRTTTIAVADRTTGARHLTGAVSIPA
jgi:acyl dehydratase